VAEWVLAGVAIVLTAAVVVSSLITRSGSQDAAPGSDPPGAAPTTAAPTSTMAPNSKPTDPNLVAEVDFEAGLAGWRPIGGTRIGRASAARAGRWAASFTATGAANQGMAQHRLLRCRPNRSYAATIWVQANRPGVLVEVNLLEYVGGRRYAVDTVGAVLADRQWQRVEVAHLVHRPGATLAVEILVPRGSPRSRVVVDELRVVAHKASFMTHG
jgi:hypothetical protein